MEATRSSETSVLTREIRRYIAEDGILLSHCRDNLKSYIFLTIFIKYFDVCLLRISINFKHF
jgi:hypothetical protein